MAKFVCTVCGYVYEGEAAPEVCPVCKAPASKFKEMDTTMAWAAEHEVGIASDVPEDIKADLRANFEGLKLVCTWLWQELLTEKVIRKSVFTGKKQLMKKLNTLLSLQNCLVKL